MYYLVYGGLYLFSLLPFFIIYIISDGICFLIYNVIGYRKNVVLYNLSIAFPEKSQAEREIIARKFYHNLVDTFLETIKLLSLSDREIRKRARMDLTACNKLAERGINIQYHSGHQMNWEYANYAAADSLTIPWIGVYMKLSNKVLDRIFYDLRAKRGTILVPAQEFKARSAKAFKSQYALGLAADQNPGAPHCASWLYFFSRPAPFVSGPALGAAKNHAAVVFVRFVKIKRGFFEFIPEIITDNGALLQPNELTVLYRDFLEKTIRETPDNYLWSHRRWKWDWKPEYGPFWIDKRKVPTPTVRIPDAVEIV